MKRPQSAKPGYRAPIHSSTDEIKEEDIQSRNNRKHVKLLKPDLTTNDFARVMPKKIYQDKERLYSEGLQLKQKLNETQQENIRLKTRISILEKQKDKLSKAIDKAAESSNTSQGRFKIYQGPNNSTDKQNMMVRNLKKMIRDTKQENDYLKQQNAKIKKAVKFTKINEVQIQCKILRDEYQKLKQVLIQLNDKLAEQEQYQKQIQQLKSYLQEQVQQNKQLAQSNQKYAEYIQELEQKLAKESEKAQEKEKKLQRQLALTKRRLNQQVKNSDQLRKQLRTLKQGPNKNLNVKKRQFPNKIIQRPTTANPNSNQQNKQPSINVQAQKKLEDLKQKNEKLQQQLKQMKKKLQQSKKQQSPDKKKQYNKQESGEKELRLDSQPKQDVNKQTQNQQFVLSQQKNNKQSNKKQKQENNFLLKQQTKIEQEEAYDDQFQSDKQQTQSPKKQKKELDSKKAVDSHVQNYYKDFQEEVEEQQLYKKDAKKQQKKQVKKQTKKKQSKKDNSQKGYQPNKQILSQIKQLLTYRMKAQRYPYLQLQKDIQASKQANFAYKDLEGMLKAEPFYLTPNYTKAMLQYLYQKRGDIDANQKVSTNILLTKLRKVIKDFELPDQKEQQERLMSIAEMTTQYPQQLQNAFEKIKNGADTVAKKDLIQMFKKLELADHFIQIIISELSLCSPDLQHLNIRGYFDRFYIQDLENSEQYAIDQQNGESSGENVGKHKSKIPKIEEEDQYEDDKANFIMEDEGELSMRGKQPAQQDYNDNMISDDDHV